MRLPIFYRYVIRETAELFFAILFILLAIILSFRLSSLLGHALEGDISLRAVWQLMAYQAILIGIVLAPVAFILSAVMTLSRMYTHNEISAIFAGGISRAHLAKILIFLAMPIAITIALLSLFIIPEVHAKRELLTDAARQEASYALLNANSFRALDDGSIIHTGDLDDGKFKNFIIFQKDRTVTPNKYSLIFSDTGHFSADNNANHFLQLSQGIRVGWDAQNNPQTASYTQFEHATVRLPDDGKEQATSIESQSTSTLGKDAKGQSELQNRLNPALALLIFTLCIPLLAHSGPRQGRMQKLLPAFILFAIYINILNTLVKAIAKGNFPIFPGCFLAHGIILIVIIAWWIWLGRRT